ncbi:hypothetical protein PoB_006802800 [Plakobranchus ocellatus]|uniref:Uncharacterized protein n=1 Tax=Plakobranchus ocellatus TaxID=259542 RepID=A0AAV4DBD4_9GAST|nr:hypothetical protein PoB_006802800 [Plakobranchus ocellatus]
MRRGKLEHLVTTGKFEGKRSRGRQREKIMDGLVTWLGTGKMLDTLAAVKDRDLWRDMIANAYKQGTCVHHSSMISVLITSLESGTGTNPTDGQCVGWCINNEAIYSAYTTRRFKAFCPSVKPGHRAGGREEARTHDRKVSADLRAGSLYPPTPRKQDWANANA